MTAFEVSLIDPSLDFPPKSLMVIGPFKLLIGDASPESYALHWRELQTLMATFLHNEAVSNDPLQ